MGRRNYFIKLKHNSNSDGYHINDIMKFVLDHNSVYDNLTEEQRKNIHELDLPGEELSTAVLTNYKKEGKELWVYLVHHGGSSYTFDWKENNYPNIKMYGSSDFSYYDRGWENWELITIQEFRNKYIIKN
jgi:hypothetical protein